MAQQRSTGDFSEAELAALLTACRLITTLAPTQSADSDRKNVAVQEMLKRLDRPIRLELESLLRKLPAILRGFAPNFLRGSRAWRLDVEDLVGDTCQYILQHNWRALCRWDPNKGTLRGYLWGAMRYRWLNFQKGAPLAELLGSLEHIAESKETDHRAFEGSREELHREFLARLAQHGIKETDIQILTLKLLDSLSTEQVAVHLAQLQPQSEGRADWLERRTMVCNKIDQRYRRAKQKLHALLLGEQPADDPEPGQKSDAGRLG